MEYISWDWGVALNINHSGPLRLSYTFHPCLLSLSHNIYMRTDDLDKISSGIFSVPSGQ